MKAGPSAQRALLIALQPGTLLARVCLADKTSAAFRVRHVNEIDLYRMGCQKINKPLATGMAWGGFTMVNQVEAESAVRVPAQGRLNVSARYRAAEARASHRITDRKLLRRVAAANGRGKRAFDLAVAICALIFLAPFLLTIALLIKLDDGGPILFRHRRIGRQGARFGCLKFRTMAVDADRKLADLLLTDPEAAAEWRETQKLRDDPRVTRLGGFLRKYSLDELPQLWNVIRGEMSIVGPRPITRDELSRYGKDRRFYLVVRPGMTGLWQVSGRSSTTYERRIRYDREYIEDWSWLGEVWIILKTVPALLRTRDAC